MKRFFLFIVILLVAVIALPPLYYTIFPVETPTLPAHGKQVEVRPGISMNYTEEGDGSPVILIHGLPGTAYDWRETSALLAQRGFRVFAYDRVGYGRSSFRGNDNFSVQANVDDLRDFIKALELKNVSVVGWSYGGVIAMFAAMQYPEQLREIILVGSGGPQSADDKRPEPPTAMKILYSTPVLKWRSAVPPISKGLMEVLSAQAFSEGVQPAWWMEGLRANFSRWETTLTYRGEMFYRDADEEDDAAVFSKVNVSTTIIHAEDDRLAPVEIGRYLASVIPDAKYQEIPAASHMLPVTHPEVIADAVTEPGIIEQVQNVLEQVFE